MEQPRPLYDDIGTDYATVRRADPRIARAIRAALGDAASVVNVGAGSGSYEPVDLDVTAVEPSAEMIRQRPPGAAPCVQAWAESLPFEDGSFDAALAVLTVHHWSDRARGLREMRRVARRRVVVLTWDPATIDAFWMVTEYLPEIADLDLPRFPTLAELEDALPSARVTRVPIPRDCEDGFLGAFWGRPEAYLDPRVRRGISVFRQLPAAITAPALERLEADLRAGVWDERHAALRGAAELDLGYRLVAAELG
ncbi:MAG: class I SAM-dependent methyltransferase [Labilithrix sp.]|nr:class I SAM-dependent methyltransferase [Labilithrix sp.]